MSVQLQELIDRIKKEGVKEAEENAALIKKKAEEEAAQIIASAKSEAESARERAESDAKQFEAASKEAIQQAGRDMLLQIKGEITALFNGLLYREIRESLDAKVVREALLSLFKELGKKGLGSAQVLLSDKDLKNVKDYILDKLSADMKKGLEIKPSAQIQAGFRVAEKDGSAYYDFTDKGLTDFLMEYLNPRVAEILGGSQD